LNLSQRMDGDGVGDGDRVRDGDGVGDDAMVRRGQGR
jgi:hypothetical protein